MGDGRQAWGLGLSPQGPSVHSAAREPGQLGEGQVLNHIQGELLATGCAGKQYPSAWPRPARGQGGQPAAAMLGLVVWRRSVLQWLLLPQQGWLLVPWTVVGSLVSALLLGGFWFSLQDAFVRILSSLSQYFRTLLACVLTGEEHFSRLCRRHLEKSGRC